MSPYRWRDEAACRGRDPELFFPVGSGTQADQQIERAKAVCAGCAVRSVCADVALTHGYEGVWGGLDDSQRRRLRHRPVAPAGHRN